MISLSHEFALLHRRKNIRRVTECYWKGLCFRVCWTQITSRYKHATTTMRPRHEVLYYRHLNTCESSLLFDVIVLDRTWILWAPHVDKEYLLSYSVVLNYIPQISTMGKAMWMKVRVTSRTSNSTPSIRYHRLTQRLLDYTPSFCFTNSLWTVRSLCLIWPYRVPFDRLLEALCDDKRICEVHVKRHEVCIFVRFQKESWIEESANNFTLWRELLFETNQASLWLPKRIHYHRMLSSEVQYLFHPRLCHWHRLLCWIPHQCPIVQLTRTSSSIAYTARTLKATIPSSIFTSLFRNYPLCVLGFKHPSTDSVRAYEFSLESWHYKVLLIRSILILIKPPKLFSPSQQFFENTMYFFYLRPFSWFSMLHLLTLTTE